MIYTVKLKAQITLETEIESDSPDAAFEFAKLELRPMGHLSDIEGEAIITQDICK